VIRTSFFKKLGPWLLISGLLLVVVVVTICSGVRNDLEEEKRNKLREEILQRQGETK